MTKPQRLGLGLAIGAAAAIAFVLYPITGSELVTEYGDDRYELIAPRMLMVLAITPFVIWALTLSLADLPRVQRWLAATLRVLLIGALALALARPAKTSDATTVSTIYMVDVSDSVTDEGIAQARQIVEAAYGARGENDLRVITFAERARALTIDLDTEALPEFERHEGTGAGTNMAAALQLAYGMFAPGHLKRVVVLSDGGQTEGDVLAEASRASTFGVKLHYHPYRTEAPREVAIRDIELPSRIKVGQPFEVKVRLFSSTAATARVRLYQGATINGLGGVRDVEVEPGETELAFRSIVRIAGPVTYRARLQPNEEDRFEENNQYETTTVVPGRPTVLYVEGSRGRGGHLARALAAADFDVDVRSPGAIPTTTRELERFDFFILSDVRADRVNLSQQDAIERYVRDLGGGFLMAGGDSAFGLGGWQGTRIARILPVHMDSQRRRDQPSLALSLVIDKSGSMSGQKMELAKEAARATAELLGSNDYISIIGFSGAPQHVVRMQSARNRLRIQRDIGRMAPGGGTNIFPALDLAYQDLAVTRARIKHTILLTDGQAPDAGIRELVQVMRAERITVSSIGLGSDVNRALLQQIANLGAGRAYFTTNPHNIPRIFMRETTTVSRSSAVEEYFQPTVVRRADFLRGINIQGSPYLRGYVATRAKAAPAQVILASDLGEPILARWRVGLGWSLAWTSDVKARWATEWLRWGSFSRFWAQLTREHMRRKRRQTLDMTAEVQDGNVHVVVDAIGGDDQFLNDLNSTVKIEGPMGARRARRNPQTEPSPRSDDGVGTDAGADADAGEAAVDETARAPAATSADGAQLPQATEGGRNPLDRDSSESDETADRAETQTEPEPEQTRIEEEHPLRQTAPGRYEATFPLDRYGSFVLTAKHLREGRRVAESFAQLANPYPREYATLETDEALLSRAAELGGGTAEPTPDEVFDPGEEKIRTYKELWQYLIYLALGLFILDLLLRRVRLFDRDFSS